MSARRSLAGLVDRLNRPRGAVAARLRVDDPLVAYAACALTATTAVAVLAAVLILAVAAGRGVLSATDLPEFILMGALRWLAVTVGGVIVAAPFLVPATWLGARLQIESALYYVIAGGLVCAALAYAVFGWPGEHPFGVDMAAWTIAPACGAAWGACWWYLHRRWKSEPSG